MAAETVSRWRKSTDAFREALGARRRELREAQAERLRFLAGKAMRVLEALLDSAKYAGGVLRVDPASAVCEASEVILANSGSATRWGQRVEPAQRRATTARG